MAFIPSRLGSHVFQFAALLIIVGGIVVRIYHLFQIDFFTEPYRLGGLFVAFAEAIVHNGFRLPASIPYYSAGGIPFAYPPLSFYVEGLLFVLFPGREIAIANLLPPTVSVLSVPFVYLFLKKAYPGEFIQQLAGLFAFAFLPNAFSSQVEAGGLAEAFGTLALIGFFVTAGSHRQYQTLSTASLTGIALALCVLTSPGSAIGATALAILLSGESLLKNRFSRPALISTATIALIGLLCSAPYWLEVMLRHGRGFFIPPVLGQYQSNGKNSFWFEILQNIADFQLVTTNGAFVWNFFIFLGILWLLLNNRPALPLALLTLFSIPRENTWLVALPAAMLFAYGVTSVLVPLAGSILDGGSSTRKNLLGLGLIAIMLGLVVQSFLLVDSFVADRQWKITPAQVNGLRQAREIIPPGVKVLILSNDAVLEWGPYLLQREVINTKFGLEWQPAERERINRLNTMLNDAQNWDDIWKGISDIGESGPIYIVSTQKQIFSALNLGNKSAFIMKLETPDVQVGLLGEP